ncbi:MAG: histidinol dehydrogenase [Acidimicrobiales bacterium]
MLSLLDLRAVDHGLAGLLPRPKVDGEGPVAAVKAILAEVEAGGDTALRRLTERFDHVRLGALAVPPGEAQAALDSLDPALRAALFEAAESITAFHEAQRRPAHVHERAGIRIAGRRQPVDRAGLYVPGGRAVYPSTVLMTALPARAAGVAELALCCPPDPADPAGRPPAVTLAAAAVAGVEEIYPIGGAQAIAALAYGTETIRRVDVIVGPGNAYVAIAKREVAGRVGIPSAFAGPSEVVVVADRTTRPDYAAIDLIVQAEHGPDGLAWLVCWEPEVAEAVGAALGRLLEHAPRRADVLATLAEGGHTALCRDPQQAMEVVNLIAPEHLELLTEAPERLVPLVRHAGAVFCGPLAPASIGDYLAGPSHVLPTFGSARFSSALTVDDFQKQLHVITVTPAGFERAAPHVAALAAAEGLDAHAQSVLLRRAQR